MAEIVEKERAPKQNLEERSYCRDVRRRERDQMEVWEELKRAA